MTSLNFSGTISFEYNEHLLLECLKIEAVLTEQQQAWLGYHMPWHYSQVEAFCNKPKSATFVLQDREVTFEMFWNRYNDKSRSSRKKTEALWNKMNKVNQVKAYMFIPKYLMSKGTADQKYATTYLSDELWNN